MENYTNQSYHESYEEANTEVKYVQVVILSVLSVLIITGNVLILTALRKVKKFQKTTKLFIFSLSIADLFVGAILIPLRLNEVFLTTWSQTVEWCKLSISVNIWNLSASSFNLLALSIEKLIFLAKPLEYDNIVTFKRCAIIIIILWCFFTSVSFIPIFSEIALQDAAVRHAHDHLCKYATTLKDEYLIYMCVCDVIPLVLFGVIYFRILQTAQQQVHKAQARISKSALNREFKHLKKTEKKNTRLLVSLVVVFYICWIPAIIAEYLSIRHAYLVTQTFIFVISALVYLNSFLNSIVYYFFNDEFRKFFKRYVCNIKIGTRTRMSGDFLSRPSTSTHGFNMTRIAMTTIKTS